ncbi:hypothetical protein ETD86_13545 [Nonomuraea turkmeniaca]|uniref:Uncharacterized protein n=1 Tax=Nonomuraea turkmeniaca TaxID=103838 RepID=A0A5S4G7L8_9ACTN|nr:hypothetical protein [Nonomuraea turkmeniaca]TMR21940.1 hypothetical protein ETD86_13545 [Nonomuraea turkmeniaca]
MCVTTQQVDALREAYGKEPDMAGYVAESYVTKAISVVDDGIQALESMPASGIGAADAHAAQLLKVLKEARERLPEDATAIMAVSDKKKPAAAKQAAKVVDGLPPQATAVSNLVKSDQTLAVSHDLAPSCTPVTASAPATAPAGASAPTRALVGWAAKMCVIRNSFGSLREDPFDDPLMGHSRFSRFVGSRLADYISSAATRMGSIGEALDEVPRTGIQEVDEHRARMASTVKKAAAKLPEVDLLYLRELPVGRLKKQAKQVTRAMAAGIKPVEGNLLSAVGRHPALAASYNVAPSCESLTSSSEPTATPLPSAKDGSDLAACRDGKCQIKVSKPVMVSVGGSRFLLSAATNGLTIVQDSGYMVMGAGGNGRFSEAGGKTTEFHVTAHTRAGAVVDISTSK